MLTQTTTKTSIEVKILKAVAVAAIGLSAFAAVAGFMMRGEGVKRESRETMQQLSTSYSLITAAVNKSLSDKVAPVNELISQEQNNLNYVPGEIIVKLKKGQAPETQISNSLVAQNYARTLGLANIFKNYKIDEVRSVYKKPQFLSQARLNEIYSNNVSITISIVNRRLRMQSLFQSRELDKVIVIKSSDIKAKAETNLKNQANGIDFTNRQNVLDYYNVLKSDTATQKLLQELKQHPQVESAQLNYVYQITSDDPLYPEMWSLDNIGQEYPTSATSKANGTPDADIDAPEGWLRTDKAGEGVLVAVIDTGVDYNHPDIKNNTWVNPGEDVGRDGLPDTGDEGEGDGIIQDEEWNNIDDDGNGYIDDLHGWDFYSDDNNALDGHGHGTHVAGTIAAEDNTIGIIGIAYRAKVTPLKGLSDEGWGYTSDLIEAVYYAGLIGADITNNSWGGAGDNPLLEQAFNTIYEAGVTSIASAGNEDGSDALNFSPAKYDSVITVSASDANDKLADFSNMGPKIDVGAPGVYILSLLADNSYLKIYGEHLIYQNDYLIISGTSMAAPHTAGVAAVIKSEHPDYLPEQIRQVLRMSADEKGLLDFDMEFGYGRLNLEKAVQLKDQMPIAIIKNPQHYDLLPKTVLIQGEVENGQQWILSYKNIQEGPWHEITRDYFDGKFSIAYDWLIFALNDGKYYLKLAVENDNGNRAEDIKLVEVDYVTIIYPVSGQAIKAVIKITGEAGDIDSWTLSYKHEEAIDWHILTSQPSNVSIEYDWNTGLLEDGAYNLKLSIKKGDFEADDTILVIIHNQFKQWIVAQDGSGDFANIQTAVDSVLPGDEILIMPGIYKETVKIVNKSGLAIVGLDNQKVILDGEGKRKTGISIEDKSSFITISNLTIQDYLVEPLIADESQSIIVTNNIIENTLVPSWGGIFIGSLYDRARNNKVENNEVYNYSGIVKDYSMGITIFNMTGKGGVNNLVSHNKIQGYDLGIEILGSVDGKIIGNEVKDNKRGIESWGSLTGGNNMNNLFKNNLIEENETGFWSEGDELNQIFFNNFINNLNMNAVINYGTDIKCDDGSLGNYWSDYNGIDSNDDKIGDTPYFIYNDSKLKITAQDNYPSMTVIPYLPQMILGDINQDRKINAQDWILMEKFLKHAQEPTEEQKELADLNANQKIDRFDWVALQKLLEEKIQQKDLPLLLGDVNQDKLVNSKDVVLIQKHLAGRLEFSESQKLSADANANKRIDEHDVELIMSVSAQIIGQKDLPLELGDFDDNDQIKSNDVIKTMKYLDPKNKPTAKELLFGDMNLNSKFDQQDLTTIKTMWGKYTIESECLVPPVD